MFQTPSYILHQIADIIRPSWGDTKPPSIPVQLPAPPPIAAGSVPNPHGILKEAPAAIASFFVSSSPDFRLGKPAMTLVIRSIHDTLQTLGFHVTSQGPYWLVRIPSGQAIPFVLETVRKVLSQRDIHVGDIGLYEKLTSETRELVLPITGYRTGSQYYEQCEPLDTVNGEAFAFLAVGHPLIAGKELTVFGFRPPAYLNPLDYGTEHMVKFHLAIVEKVLGGVSSAGTFVDPFANYMYAVPELKPVDTVQFRRTPQFGVSLYRKGADPERHLPLTTLNTGRWYTGVLMPTLYWPDWAQSGLQGVLNRTAAEIKQTYAFLMGLPPEHGY